ncbi:P-loop containing nucleoside triphosphate hydrolase protein [Suillus paluster]|uniref:P-loop containing nucleoside triphosphate hydrolase protein n=1 Tax=Suillus paluster TaxID=48578 RepID=UPI001B872BC9|nr:P-loop containing nucleoside triphosphate hydrolase protein [Suillus paluster]KAG1749885.1 P-loop containing nucleoside triphosphate hydrolase protein [Suillus paluster]
MSFPSSAVVVLYRSWARQSVCRKHALLRYMSHSSEVHAKEQSYAKSTGHAPQDVVTFESLGVRTPIAASLRAAFPHVQQPTTMQRKLISGVVGKQDILLQDFTGTGKSFGLLLGLLSKPRISRYDPEKGKDNATKGITTLLIVPHRDLAYQFLHWLHHMLTSAGEPAPYSLASIAQVLVRGSPPENLKNSSPRILEAIVNPSSSGISVLREYPPHILIATPTALIDVLHKEPEVLQLSTLTTVVVDEVDSLLQVVPQKGSKHAREKAERLNEKHPPILKTVLDVLYTNTKTSSSQLRKRLLEMKLAPIHRPQLIMLSATMRNRLRTAFFGTYGWFRSGQVLKLIKASSSSRAAHGLNRTITHHILVVSQDGSVKNIAGARKPRALAPPDSSGTANSYVEDEEEEEFIFDEDDEALLVDDTDTDMLQAPPVFTPGMLEAVASAFALDVPNIALLVVPATTSVRRVIFELNQLGVNAHGLDLVDNEAGRVHLLSKNSDIPDENPTLLVSTLATTRGIDFPALTHVFLLGLPEGRAGDVYQHVAGRVGRFGRQGKVITVLEGRREDEGKKGKVSVRDDSRKMEMTLKKLGIPVTKVEHFD